MAKIAEDFKKFILRGNVVDMAVGIIVGGAFSTIVKSLVDDVVMPPIGLVLGNVDFEDLFIVLREGNQALPPYPTVEVAQEAGAVTLNYGIFINNVVSFLIIAAVIFFAIRAMTRLQDLFDEEQEAEKKQKSEPKTRSCPFCQEEVADKAVRCPHSTSQLVDLQGRRLQPETRPA